jgi:hypothetical protein
MRVTNNRAHFATAFSCAMFYSPESNIRIARWETVNRELDTNVGGSTDWKDLDIDDHYNVPFEVTWGKFEEIETVVLTAQQGKANSSQSSWTLLHWAAHCNKTWPISQFLLDTEHVDVMALDSQGKTALDIALACNPPSTAAAEMLQAHITKNKLVAKKPAVQSSQSVPVSAEKSPAVSSSQEVSKALKDAKAAAVLAEKQALEQAQALALQQTETAKQTKALQEAKALADKTAEQARIAAEKAVEQERLRIAAESQTKQLEAQRVQSEKEKAQLEEKRTAAEKISQQQQKEITELKAKEAAREKAESEKELARQKAEQAEKEKVARETQDKLTAQTSAKTVFTKLPIAELLKACRDSQPNFEIAKQVLREKLLTLKKMDLANAQLTSVDITPLIEIVENEGQPLSLVLQQINLAQNALDDDVLISLFPLFQACGSTLQTLNLANNEITSVSISGFINLILPEFKKLFSLTVSVNGISEKSLKKLEQACEAKNIELTVASSPLSSEKVKSATQVDTPKTTSGKEEVPISPAAQSPTPPAQLAPADSISSTSSQTPKLIKPYLDEQGGIRVQFTIPYAKLEFGKILGEGGFGVVHQGKYAHTDVAIKCIQAHKLTEHALEELKSESLFMVQLRHPNVVQCYGACLEPGHYSLVMELMPKGSLYDLLQNKQEISWGLRAQIAVDIASGLAYLHDQQIVHRDLKSMNVLLSDNLRAKINDFGLSKIKTESQATTANTKKGIGTTRWMAPELFDDEPSNTAASDVYSFAMVLWELTSRSIPYAKLTTDIQVARQIERGNKEKISDDCPSELSQIITACWETKPKHRLTSSQAAEQLNAWCCLFKSESQQPTVGTKTAVMNKLDEIAAGVKLGIALQVPPVPHLSSSPTL